MYKKTGNNVEVKNTFYVWDWIETIFCNGVSVSFRGIQVLHYIKNKILRERNSI